ncbi:MAG: RNA polymerase sigma factor [Bacteroidota bacterium]
MNWLLTFVDFSLPMVKNEALLQERLREGDKKALGQLYSAYKAAFLAYFRERVAVGMDIEDLYQDSVIAVYQNYVLNQLQLKKGSVKTYLFAVGKNKLAAKFNASKSYVKEDFLLTQPYFEVDEDQMRMEQQLLLKEFKQLGEKCREMLRLHYYRGLTDKEIVEKTGYKDENTIKSYRSRCLKKLKEAIHGSGK